MNELRPVATPMERQTFRERPLGEPTAFQLDYKEAIRSLQYAATISRLNISYTNGKYQLYKWKADKFRQEPIVDPLGGSETNTQIST